MKAKLHALFFLLAGSTATAADLGHVTSAFRHPEEPSSTIISQYMESVDTQSALEQSLPYSEVDLRGVPALGNMQELERAFQMLRDSRAWRWEWMPDFARRIPWLYLEDGCYVRAALMVEELQKRGFPAPKQAMVFGDLSASNDFSSASWWFHVAPLYQIQGVPYVLDPSVDPDRPLLLEAWLGRITPSVEEVALSVCSEYSVTPEVDCSASRQDWDSEDRATQLQQFLGLEWEMLEGLGESADSLLGESPPWSR